jgi:hypothetical protein
VCSENKILLSWEFLRSIDLLSYIRSALSTAAVPILQDPFAFSPSGSYMEKANDTQNKLCLERSEGFYDPDHENTAESIDEEDSSLEGSEGSVPAWIFSNF